MLRKKVQTSFPMKEYNELIKIAKRKKKPISSLIRETVEELLIKKDKIDWASDPFFQLGAEGKITGSGIYDLSAQHDKYLYGEKYSCKSSKYWKNKK